MSVWKAGLAIWDGHGSQARLALSIEWFADRGPRGCSDRDRLRARIRLVMDHATRRLTWRKGAETGEAGYQYVE